MPTLPPVAFKVKGLRFPPQMNQWLRCYWYYHSQLQAGLTVVVLAYSNAVERSRRDHMKWFLRACCPDADVAGIIYDHPLGRIATRTSRIKPEISSVSSCTVCVRQNRRPNLRR